MPMPMADDDFPEGVRRIDRDDRRLLRAFLAASLIVLATTTLHLASAVLIPIALATLFGAMLTPFVGRIQSQGLGKGWAVAVAMLAFAAIAGLLGLAMSSDVRHLGQRFSTYGAGLRNNLDAWLGDGSPVHRMLRLGSADAPPANAAAANSEPSANAAAAQASRQAAAVAAAVPAAQWLADLAGAIAGAFLRFVGGVSLTFGLLWAILLQGDDLRDRLLRLAGFGQVTRSTRLLEDATRMVGAYLYWHALANLGFGIAFAALLWCWGIPYATSWGILAAAARFVPYVGTWIGMAPALALAAAVCRSPAGFAGVAATALALGAAFNSVIDRTLTSRATGLSAVALVLSAAFWTWLWGPLGLVLSTPIMVCATTLGRHFEGLRPLASLLEREGTLEPSFRFYQRLVAGRFVEAAEVAETQQKELGAAGFGDQVLAPALALLDADAAAGAVDAGAAQALRAEVEAMLADMAAPATPSETPVALFASARPADVLAASWLARQAAADVPVAFAGSSLMVSGLAASIRSSPAALAVLTALDDDGLSRVRHVLKMLKKDNCRTRVLVFFAGELRDRPGLDAELRGWGANDAAGTFGEALRKIRASSTLIAAA